MTRDSFFSPMTMLKAWRFQKYLSVVDVVVVVAAAAAVVSTREVISSSFRLYEDCVASDILF